jgi:hypothetical protein
MANQIKINLSLPGNWVPLANIYITDNNTHTYLSDPPNSNGQGIDIIHLGNSLGDGGRPIKAYALWILNNENQDLNVTPICNIVKDGSLIDIGLVPTYTVSQGYTDWRMFPFSNYPVEYLSLYLKYNTAPTGGASIVTTMPIIPITYPVPPGVYVVLYIYYG